MTKHSIAIIACFSLIQLILNPAAFAGTVFTIGNSLTWDAGPTNVDDAQWHIFCNKNLRFIADNPADHCIPTSRRWTDALANQQFDYVSVQPFIGTTLQDDLSVISQWMSMQPNAQFVLHTGWGGRTAHGTVWNSTPNDLTTFSTTAAYFDALESALEQQTGRDVYRTGAGDLLASIAQDIAAGSSPYTSLSQLYRDDIHMSYGEGRYLMNNVMRLALNQELTLTTGPEISPQLAYLNQKLVALAIPEPSVLSLGCIAVVVLATGHSIWRRRTTVVRPASLAGR